jgi:beta-glucuronidase
MICAIWTFFEVKAAMWFRAQLGILLLLLAAVSASGDDKSQFPLRDVAASACVDLSGRWQLRFDSSGEEGVSNSWFSVDHDRSEWQQAVVPGVWGRGPGEIEYPVSPCVGWYSRQVEVPAEWTEDTAIAVLGSMFVTDAWVNGEYIGVHRGGYLPFFFDISRHARPGAKLHLVLRVSSVLGADTIPGRYVGWQPFGGLYREVYLLHRPRIRLEHLETTTTLAGDGTAHLAFAAELRNGAESGYVDPVTVSLMENGRVVAETSCPVSVSAGGVTNVAAALIVHNPRLWSPDDPWLYDFRVAWGAAAGKSIKFPVGLREIAVRDGKVFLNGARYWLQGFGQHEEYWKEGPCITTDHRLADLELMKNTYRANSLRPGHYPHHPELYSMCDRLGLMVFSEVPAWQVDSNYMDSDEAWRAWLEPQLREMVESQRNHASVVAWSASNETRGCYRYFKRANDYFHELDPSRLAILVMDSTYDPASAEFSDLCARNFHYGWYHSETVYGIRAALKQTLQIAGGKPIWIAEQGGLASRENLSGAYGSEARGSEQYLDKILRYGFQYAATESDAVAGITIWSWTDFHENNRITAHGIFDEKREPKLAAYTVCNLFRGDIRLFICEDDCSTSTGKLWSASLRCFNPRQREQKGLKATWRILAGSEQLDSGTIIFDVSAKRAFEIGKVEWAMPAGFSPSACTLWVELRDADGKWLHTNSSMFDARVREDDRSDIAAFRTGILRVQTVDDGRPMDGTWAMFAGIRMPVYAGCGLIVPLPPGEYAFEFCAEGRAAIAKTVTIREQSATDLVVDFAGDDSDGN